MSTGTARTNSWLESFAFHEESGTYRADFDPETTAASMAVVGALAEVTAIDPTEFEPLYDVVDTDALDAIVCSDRAGQDAQVSFAFEGRKVTVDTHGTVAIDALLAVRENDRGARGSAE